MSRHIKKRAPGDQIYNLSYMQRTCRRLTRRAWPDVLIESISSRTRTTQRQQDATSLQRLTARTSFEPERFRTLPPLGSRSNAHKTKLQPSYCTTNLVRPPTLMYSSFFHHGTDTSASQRNSRPTCALCHRGRSPAIPSHCGLCIWCRRASILFPASLSLQKIHVTRATCNPSPVT